MDKDKEIAFTHRQLQAWQPALSPMTAAASLLGTGALLLGLGIGILVDAYGSTEISVDYTDGVHHGPHGVGWFQMTIPKDMEPPIIVKYEIQGFSQSNQLYQRSRSDAQLKGEGEPRLRPGDEELKACHPRISHNDRVLYPCGLMARSIFNDTFVLRALESGAAAAEPLELDQSQTSLAPGPNGGGFGYRQLNPESIADGRALHSRLHMWLTATFPPTTCEQVDFSVPFEPVEVAWRQESTPEGKIMVVDCWEYSTSPRCNFLKSGRPFNCSVTHREVQRPEWGLDSGHFAAWMQTAGAAGGALRKPWAVIRKPLAAGTIINVSFVDRYPVNAFQGRKLIVLCTESWTGSSSVQTEFLFGWVHLGLGACATLLGLWYFLAIWQHGQDLGATNFLDRISTGR